MVSFKLLLALVIFSAFIVVFIRYPQNIKNFLIIGFLGFIVYLIIAFVITKIQEEN